MLPTVTLAIARGAGAEFCESDDALRERVIRGLGRDPFSSQASRHLRIEIAQAAEGTYARLVSSDGDAESGHRDFPATASCIALFDDLGVAIATAIDPLAPFAVEPSAPEPAPPEPAPHPVEPHPPEPHPPEPPADEPAHLGASIGARLHGSTNTTPGLVGGGGGVRASLTYGLLDVGLEGRADARTALELPGGRQAAGFMLLGTVAPCARLGWFEGCALGSAGILQADGVTGTSVKSFTAPAAFLGGRLGVHTPVATGVFLMAGLDVLVPLVRTHLVDEAGTVLWESPPVSASLSAGVGVDLF
jgi:hypothetical protein